MFVLSMQVVDDLPDGHRDVPRWTFDDEDGHIAFRRGLHQTFAHRQAVRRGAGVRDPEPNSDPERQSRCTVLITGVDSTGAGTCVKVRGFRPSLYFCAETAAGTPWSKGICIHFIRMLENGLREKVAYQLRRKYRLYGFYPVETGPSAGDRRKVQFLEVYFRTVSDLTLATRLCGTRGCNRQNYPRTLRDVPAHEGRYISPENKFCDQLGIRFNTWIQVRDARRQTCRRHSTVPNEFSANCLHVRPVSLSCGLSPPRILVCSMDIETYTPRQKTNFRRGVDEQKVTLASGKTTSVPPRRFPDAEQACDPVIMVASAFWWTDESPEKADVVVQCLDGPQSSDLVGERRGVRRPTRSQVGARDVDEATDADLATSVPFTLEVYPTEQHLIDAWARLVTSRNTMILTGFNIWKFDYAYLVERARRTRADGLWCMGLLLDFPSSSRIHDLSSAALGDNRMTYLEIFGCTSIDVYHYVKANVKMDSYSLRSIANKYLPETQQKIDLGYTEMMYLFEQTPEDRYRIADYCAMDALLPILLMGKLSIVPISLEMGNVTRTSLYDIMTRGQQQKVCHLLLGEAHERGYVMDNIPTYREQEEKATAAYEGATVIEPRRGYYGDPVVTLDFASLYPSVIRTYNLCYSTHVPNPEKYAHIPNMQLVTYGTHTFVQHCDGILPEIERSILEARSVAKRDLARETDPMCREILNGRQLALKISANSVYGFTGCGAKGRYPNRAIASTVTYLGRDLLLQSRTIIEQRWPVEVIYGDTDSVMILCRGLRDRVKLTSTPTSSSTVASSNPDLGVVGDPKHADSAALSFLEVCMDFGAEAAAYVTAEFKRKYRRSAIDLEFEKVYRPYLLMRKKRYVGLMYTGLADKGKIDCKGINLVRRDNCRFAKHVASGVVQRLIRDMDVQGAVRYLVQESTRLTLNPYTPPVPHESADVAGGVRPVPLEDFVVTKCMRATYKNRNLPHLFVANLRKQRDPGTEPIPGDRVPFVIIIKKGLNLKYFEKAEDPSYALRNKLPLDVDYYFMKQIRKPLMDLIDVAAPGLVSHCTAKLVTYLKSLANQSWSRQAGNRSMDDYVTGVSGLSDRTFVVEGIDQCVDQSLQPSSVGDDVMGAAGLCMRTSTKRKHVPERQGTLLSWVCRRRGCDGQTTSSILPPRSAAATGSVKKRRGESKVN